MFKKFLIIVVLISTNTIYSQSKKSLIDKFKNKNQFKIVSTSELKRNELNLEYLGEITLPKRIFARKKIHKVSYLFVNTKVKEGKTTPQKFNKYVIETDSYFDINESNKIVLNKRGNGSFLIFNQNKHEFSRKIVLDRPYDDEIVCQHFKNRNTDINYYILEDENSNLYLFEDSQNNDVNDYTSLLVDEIKDYVGLDHILKDGYIYSYKVDFIDKGGDILTTLAYTNIDPDKIKLVDFEKVSNYHKVYKSKYKAERFEFLDKYPFSQLIDGVTRLNENVYPFLDINTSNYSYWENKKDEDDVRDQRISYEVIDVINNPENHKKYNIEYFKNKFQNENFFESSISLDLDLNLNSPPSLKFTFKSSVEDSYLEDEKNIFINNKKLWVNFGNNNTFYLPQKDRDHGFETPSDIIIVLESFLTTLNGVSYETEPIALKSLSESSEKILSGYSFYLEKKRKEKIEEESQLNNLYEKYGKSFVDLALNGEIVIGMHKELTFIPLKLWVFDYSRRFNDTMYYYYESRLNSSTRLKLSIRDDKVVSVSVY